VTNTYSKLSETFDIPNNTSEIEQDHIDDLLDQAKSIEKMAASGDVDMHDEEMDEISEMAVTAHRDLLEVGMNVDTRTAGEILGTSATMLKIALDARNSKMDKKLRLIKLQMDKMKLDHAMAKEDNTPVDGGTLTMDRNELIAQIQNATKNR
jgi:hypothetical protein